MATTADWVFNQAIYLMDEQSESSGATLTPDTKEYRHRTLGILNVLRYELYPYSDTCEEREDGKRPVCRELLSFEEDIDLDDALAQGVLPYGLAAHLLLGENDTMAGYFSQRYEEALARIRSTRPGVWEEIPMFYGGLDG